MNIEEIWGYGLEEFDLSDPLKPSGFSNKVLPSLTRVSVRVVHMKRCHSNISSSRLQGHHFDWADFTVRHQAEGIWVTVGLMIERNCAPSELFSKYQKCCDRNFNGAGEMRAQISKNFIGLGIISVYGLSCWKNSLGTEKIASRKC